MFSSPYSTVSHRRRPRNQSDDDDVARNITKMFGFGYENNIPRTMNAENDIKLLRDTSVQYMNYTNFSLNIVRRSTTTDFPRVVYTKINNTVPAVYT